MAEVYSVAAVRHFDDAESLSNLGRLDNASHLLGFAVECAIKHAYGLVEPQDDSPRVHLPDLANAILKRVSSRDPAKVPLRNLLEKTRGGFFNDWRVSSRYDRDGLVDVATYRKWLSLAERAFGAAGLRR